VSDQARIDALHGRLRKTMPRMSELCAGPRPELFRSLLSRIGDKWTMLVIGILAEGRQRFTAISDAIPGISRRMLTVTLRALERDGLVRRSVFAEVPPRVEYELTPLGRSLQEVSLSLADWVSDHQHEIVDHREQFDTVHEQFDTVHEQEATGTTVAPSTS
jgi:DNA-binding HxlR family transcriptional regulator